MTRTDLWILAVLLKEQASDYMLAMSIDEIIEAGAGDIARITVYKHLKKLLSSEYIAVGAKNNRADCFYLTEKGKNILKKDGEKNAQR